MGDKSIFEILPTEVIVEMVAFITAEEPASLHSATLIQPPRDRTSSRDRIRKIARLARVNSRMWGIVYSMPLFMYLTHSTNALRWATTCLNRSTKSAPVDVDLVVHFANVPSHFDKMIDTIKAVARRTRTLRVSTYCHQVFVDVTNFLKGQKMPILQAMLIHCTTGHNVALNCPSAPRLDTLSMKVPLQIGRDFSLVTRLHLELTGLVRPQMVVLVNKFKALEVLHISRGNGPNVPLSLPYTSRLQCPHLISLTITNGNLTFPPEILAHLDAPKLKTVYITVPWMHVDPTLRLHWVCPPNSSTPSVKRLVVQPLAGLTREAMEKLMSLNVAQRDFLVERFPEVTELEIHVGGTGLLAVKKAKCWNSLSSLRIRRGAFAQERIEDLEKSLRDVKDYVDAGGRVAKLEVDGSDQEKLAAVLEELTPLVLVKFH